MVARTSTHKKPGLDLPNVNDEFIDQTIERATGAELIYGNDIRLLIDATENYPAWLDAINNAQNRIYFECYIVHEDEQGALFAEALIKKAEEGVEVKIIYDWLGGLGNTSRRYWNMLRRNGVEVRCYNPPHLIDPLSAISRDHRKTITIDGNLAFVGGLCVGEAWVGWPDRDIPPWRDTGVQITGPAVADVEAAFADVWKAIGTPLESSNVAGRKDWAETGSTALRVVASQPGTAHVYRTDQLLATAAQESMWLTDAYFIGVPSYLQALKDAAADGVDVRILVPQSTDIGIIRDTTRSTYRPLLEGGIRVFEWNGPMMHAKTAVFDGKFSRVGSTNLNIASWFGNYELDVLVEDQSFGREMQDMFLRDLENSTEIVLSDTIRNAPKKNVRNRHRQRRRGDGSMRKATAGALNAATSIGSAIAGKAPLGAAESRLLFIVGGVLFLLALVFILFPRIASIPLIIIFLMLAFPALIKAVRNYRNG
jgi:cardiolipin synthase A/B